MEQNSATGVKQAVDSVMRALPDSVSWEEVQYRLFVRQQIEAGLADSEAGRIVEAQAIHCRLDEANR